MINGDKQAKFMSIFIKYLTGVGKNKEAAAFIKYNNGNAIITCHDKESESFSEYSDRMTKKSENKEVSFSILYLPSDLSIFLHFLVRDEEAIFTWKFTGSGFIPVDLDSSKPSIH